MSAADSKKTKKRKSRKGVKPSNTSVTTKFALQSNFANGSATVEVMLVMIIKLFLRICSLMLVLGHSYRL